MCPVMSSKISHSTIPHAPSPENACSKCSELGLCEHSWGPGDPGTPWLITSPRTCCVEQAPVPLRFVLCKSIMGSPSANARIGSRCSTIHAIESWLKCHPHVTMGGCVCVRSFRVKASAFLPTLHSSGEPGMFTGDSRQGALAVPFSL